MPANKRANATASLRHENDYYRAGYRNIIGLDEAGRGPWAGPVSAAAVALPLHQNDVVRLLRGVKDSKQMTARQREQLVENIKSVASTWGIGSASASEIDALGMMPATRLAMQRALEMATSDGRFTPDCLFLDYMPWPEMGHYNQLSILGGDQLSLSIAAASVLAKTWRDSYMIDIAEEFPYYGFEVHKGYGTPAHQVALKQYGPCPIHRMSFKPVQAAIHNTHPLE